jgi:hypothetical protein
VASLLCRLDKGSSVQFRYDIRHLVRSQFGIDWQRQELTGDGFGNRQVAPPIPEVRICLLQVNGDRIMDACLDARGMEHLLDAITMGNSDRVHMVNMPAVLP